MGLPPIKSQRWSYGLPPSVRRFKATRPAVTRTRFTYCLAYCYLNNEKRRRGNKHISPERRAEELRQHNNKRRREKRALDWAQRMVPEETFNTFLRLAFAFLATIYTICCYYICCGNSVTLASPNHPKFGQRAYETIHRDGNGQAIIDSETGQPIRVWVHYGWEWFQQLNKYVTSGGPENKEAWFQAAHDGLIDLRFLTPAGTLTTDPQYSGTEWTKRDATELEAPGFGTPSWRNSGSAPQTEVKAKRSTMWLVYAVICTNKAWEG